MHSLGSSAQQARSVSVDYAAALRLPSRTIRTLVPRRGDAQVAHVAPVLVASQVVSTVTVAVAAWWFSKQLGVAQDTMNTSRRPCPRCNGTGYEACMCTKWSDEDVGCNSCSSSPGYTKCSACGGGGTAVPIKVAISRNNAM
eukprot:GHRR01001068.1.p1 GENE.GHRR01001068.1~~GHRR01001068.1.p1  ORF type:complete len:142 (+),score=0.12 GHRR01001068.1:204-629(+)